MISLDDELDDLDFRLKKLDEARDMHKPQDEARNDIILAARRLIVLRARLALLAGKRS